MAYPNLTAVITARGSLQGQPTVTRLPFYRENVVAGLTSEILATAFYDSVWSVWKTCVHQAFVLNEIEGVVYQNPTINSSPPYVKFVQEQGTLTSTDCLPPYVTVSMWKVVNNSLKEPSGIADFRNGRVRFSGVPEGHQSLGLLTPTALTLWQTLADALEDLTVTVAGTGYVLGLGVDRYQIGGFNPMVYVDSVQTSYKLGTQNSRKY